MNFQTIAPIERSRNYLDRVFKKAREKSRKELKGDWLEKIKKKEIIKLDVIKGELVSNLDKIVKDFPRLEELPKFYLELLKLTLEYGELKKSLGAVSWAIGKIRFFHRDYIRKISKSRDAKKIRNLEKEFYGRISSIVRQIDEQLFFLEESRRIMKKYPDIKEMFTIVIFGFPNVGKTTLLNKLTGAKGKVAEYAFTTTGINSGFIKIKEKEVQVLDVPGTLARPEKMNDIERIAYLAAKELANIVIFVFDISGTIDLEKQKELFRNLKKEFEKEILIYLSKTDIIEEAKVKKFKENYRPVFGAEELKEEINKLVG